MDNTNVFVIMFMYMLLTSPAWLEAFVIDPLFWRKLKDDKPISTYIRGFHMISAAVLVEGLQYGHWYYGVMLTFFFHVLFFAPFINLKLKRPIDYLGLGKYDMYIKKIPLWIRLVVSVLLLSISVYLLETFKY